MYQSTPKIGNVKNKVNRVYKNKPKKYQWWESLGKTKTVLFVKAGFKGRTV